MLGRAAGADSSLPSPEPASVGIWRRESQEPAPSAGRLHPGRGASAAGTSAEAGGHGELSQVQPLFLLLSLATVLGGDNTQD